VEDIKINIHRKVSDNKKGTAHRKGDPTRSSKRVMHPAISSSTFTPKGADARSCSLIKTVVRREGDWALEQSPMYLWRVFEGFHPW
jgi:hypothetical protein